MAKEKMKRSELHKLATKDPVLAERLEQVTGMSISDLIKRTSLVDTHRDTPRAEGGTYADPENVSIHAPIDHMKIHDNFRLRTPEMDELKTLVDDRNQLIKLSNGINSRLLAYDRRTDHPNPKMKLHLEQQLAFTKRTLTQQTAMVEKAVKALEDPMAKVALKVDGVGAVTVAYCLVYFDLGGFFPATILNRDGSEKPHPRAGQEKCPHASSLWKYTGDHTASHERFTKGEAGGGNKTLRTQLFTFADSQMKASGTVDKNGQSRTKGAYHDIYHQVKSRLEVSDKLTSVRVAGKSGTQELPWKHELNKNHRHGSALRAVRKHFVADWWFVGRTLMGLDTNPSYATAQLGKSHRTIDPEGRGWDYKEALKEIQKAKVVRMTSEDEQGESVA